MTNDVAETEPSRPPKLSLWRYWCKLTSHDLLVFYDRKRRSMVGSCLCCGAKLTWNTDGSWKILD
jgi:hypothetical protein